MNLRRVFDIVDFQVAHHAAKSSLRYLDQGVWHEWVPSTLRADICDFAQGLSDAGLRHGDRVLIIPKACHPLALIIDLAVQMLGAVPVIVHSTFAKEQMYQVLDEIEPKFIFSTATDYLTDVLSAYVANKNDRMEGLDGLVMSYLSCDRNSALFERFKANGASHRKEHALGQDVQEDDLAGIIYTSGSSGRPKGVMLTHRNIMSNLGALTPLIPLSSGSVVLSYLPYSHILERAAIYAYLMMGMQINVIDEVHQLSAVFRKVQPEFVTAVPRIIERISDGFERFRRQRGWWRKKSLNWVIHLAQRPLAPGQWQLHLQLFHWVARYFFFRKFRVALGGRLKGIVVGGAHLRPALTRLFEVAGIPVREGYGMTETSPIISINRFAPGLHRIGSVGLPLPNVEVKLNSDGEILVKGPNVTQGYFNQPEQTRQLFDPDGWLKTGDVGEILEGGFLKITDRKKEIIKTSAGKYIAPAMLEALFLVSPFINQIMIVGFQRPYPVAIIVPNFEMLESWCTQQKIHWTSPIYMVHNIKVKEIMDHEIEVINKKLPKFKRVQKHILSSVEWTVENGLLSASYKPLRRNIESQFNKEVKGLYGN